MLNQTTPVAARPLTEAIEVLNEALNTLKSLRDDLIHCNESPASPIPEVTKAARPHFAQSDFFDEVIKADIARDRYQRWSIFGSIFGHY